MSNEDLAVSIKAGNREQISVLWGQIAGLIATIAGAWKRAHPDALVDVDDLMQSGFFAMMNAVQYYDPDKGHPFTSCLSLTLKTSFAEAACLRTQKQQRTAQICTTSLDAPVGGDDDHDLLVDMIADPDAPTAFLALETRDEQREIREVLEDASARLLTDKQRGFFEQLEASYLHPDGDTADGHKVTKRESQMKAEVFWKLKTDEQVIRLHDRVCGFDEDADIASSSLKGTGLAAFKRSGYSSVERAVLR